jgi:hypothetical protein
VLHPKETKTMTKIAARAVAWGAGKILRRPQELVNFTCVGLCSKNSIKSSTKRKKFLFLRRLEVL